MGLQIERIPTLQDNYTYLLVCDESGEAAVVDAPEAAPVVSRVEKTGARVAKILSTHHHPDHSMANPELARRYGVPVFGHASDRDRIPGFTDGLDEGDTVDVGRQRARVLHIPCHTRGHVAYVFDEAQAVFSGDMLFAGGCGRTFEGTPAMMYTALCEKLAALKNLQFGATIEPDNRAIREKLARVEAIRAKAAPDWHDATPEEMTIPSTIGEERETNVFMRVPDAEELGRIRALKDRF
jgi:hydroxyacylglutathione hydrolase